MKLNTNKFIDRRTKDGGFEARKLTSDIIRVRRITDRNIREIESKAVFSAFMLALCIFMAVVILLCFMIGSAHAYSDDQYVNAIRHAEGTWTYGIKTVKCNSEGECKRIALRTVHNNRIRFSTYGYRKYSTFISFLGSRYCPINAGNDPQGLNVNWISNVSYWLRKD